MEYKIIILILCIERYFYTDGSIASLVIDYKSIQIEPACKVTCDNDNIRLTFKKAYTYSYDPLLLKKAGYV